LKSLKFHQPQPNGGQLATIFPGSLVNVTQYVSKKREGSTGQQKKALQMFTSRKIVNVKTLADGQEVYVKAMIKKVLLVHATPHSYYV